VGVLLLEADEVAKFVGASGAVVSIVILNALEYTDVLPAVSVAVAVIE